MLRLQNDHPAPLRLAHDGIRQRMLRRALQRGGKLQKRLLVYAHRRKVGDDGLALRERAGLVHHHSVHAVQQLQTFGGLKQHALLRAAPRAHHDGNGRRQTQRARARDDQHRHRRGQRKFKRLPQDQPHDGGDERDRHDDRHEHARDAVGKPCDGRFRPARLLHQPDDLRERRILADLVGAEFEEARLVDRRGGDAAAGRLFHGDALAGQRALIDRRAALEHHAVHGDAPAGAHEHHVAEPDLLHRDL